MTSRKPSLAETHPELAAQADGWDPTSLSKGSTKKVAWICKLDHKWQASVNNRSQGSGCPYCSGNKIMIGFNDLASVRPELAAQADGWDPTKLTAGSKVKVTWKCPHNHKWKAMVKDRSFGYGCPVCAGRAVHVGFNDLATIRPELAAQADGWDPSTLTEFSYKKVRWKCQRGHKWEARVSSRSTGNGCPVCDGKTVLVGFNDLGTVNPKLAAQANGWDPTTLTAGSNKKVGWKCELGHKWESIVAGRSKGNGCPVCDGKTVLVGFNDLGTVNPKLAAQANGWDPTTLTAGSGKKVGWKCEHGHNWRASVGARSKGNGCAVCDGRQVQVGVNDLATVNPKLAAQADGWDPTTLTAGSNKKVGWKCELGHQWKAIIVNRKTGTGCPSCAIGGFDPNQPGFLYFIDHFDLQMFQIGITNFPDDRLGDHKRRGWEVVELRGPMDGHLTQKLETDCLHALEKRGALLGHKAGIEKFDGYTEAWTKASLNMTSIKQILDWVYEDEAKVAKSANDPARRFGDF
jgi:Zn finger protein HypA/HybF involved in hydrogenase expression